VNVCLWVFDTNVELSYSLYALKNVNSRELLVLVCFNDTTNI